MVLLSPEPVITRGETWLQAALFYSKYLAEIKEIYIFSFIIIKL